MEIADVIKFIVAIIGLAIFIGDVIYAIIVDYKDSKRYKKRKQQKENRKNDDLHN